MPAVQDAQHPGGVVRRGSAPPISDSSNRRTTRNHLGVLTLLLTLLGCAGADRGINPALTPGARNGGYGLAEINASGGRPDLLIFVAFSGGGKRSAAFGHGALRGMRDVPVTLGGPPSTLLAEVDQVAGVSGGSFTAAHYALYGEQSFETFPRDFLHRDLAAYVWGTYILPWQWGWLVDPAVGTNDRMTEVYDDLMFRGATFRELMARGRPRLSINATDLASGSAFPFLPHAFDVICSDLGRFSVARAVAASNGFPLLFTPITLANHRGPNCDAPLPVNLSVMPMLAEYNRRRLVDVVARMADRDRTPWIHLLDGGISDNLALRATLNFAILGGTDEPDFASLVRPVRRILMISVDGQSATDPALSRQRMVNGLVQIFDAVSGGQIDNYNLETLAVTAAEVERMVGRQRENRCQHAPAIDGWPCEDVQGLLVHVSLADHPDPALRSRLRRVPTGLTLPDDDVDLLVAAGETVIRGNRAIAGFLGADGSVPAPRPVRAAHR
ncbi:patatin-like phospholipase family protein [Roseomonas sp. HJA6]|uniref:Patatin-like phospholipase family protein n=1 Tax=Roseomonas alba TaxID=2846776 RepID=A0ABS7AEX6_9PROT|nr:patatin-like phospholipase family protein [Neoroseomonas alba]